MNRENLPTYADALKNLLTLVGDISGDKTLPETLQERAATVLTDFMIAAIFQVGAKHNAEKGAAQRGTELHAAVEDNYGRSSTCGQCKGRGQVCIDYDKAEWMICETCHGSGRG